jgi:cytochrome c peroxidase
MPKMVELSTKDLLAASVAAMLLLASGGAMALTPLEELGKNVFFDEKLSRPANKQACASCHNPAKGWTLPNSAINKTTVVAPGAAPKALGSIKPPQSAYASLHPMFQPAPGFGAALPAWGGGNFWDGRAEGCGAESSVPCRVAPPGGAVSETITQADVPSQYHEHLGPTADQALNPFPNDVEQNIREKSVCQAVKTAKYKALYKAAYGSNIDCSPVNDRYRTSYKRIAVALAAWQSSKEVNSFSSKRDKALAADGDKKFPLDSLTDLENKGHDIFYGIKSAFNPDGKNARCTACHNGLPNELAPPPPTPVPDPEGVHPEQLYTDHRYHNIGLPFNREIPGVARGVKVGLSAHVKATDVTPGFFKTPTLRNVGKGASSSFTKAYGHNGYFKTVKQIVHFYNTRDSKKPCADANATAAEALAADCWPSAEFPENMAGAPGAPPAFDFIGNLGLSSQEEDAIVAYLNTLSDQFTVSAP